MTSRNVFWIWIALTCFLLWSYSSPADFLLNLSSWLMQTLVETRLCCVEETQKSGVVLRIPSHAWFHFQKTSIQMCFQARDRWEVIGRRQVDSAGLRIAPSICQGARVPGCPDRVPISDLPFTSSPAQVAAGAVIFTCFLLDTFFWFYAFFILSF